MLNSLHESSHFHAFSAMREKCGYFPEWQEEAAFFFISYKKG